VKPSPVTDIIHAAIVYLRWFFIGACLILIAIFMGQAIHARLTLSGQVEHLLHALLSAWLLISIASLFVLYCLIARQIRQILTNKLKLLDELVMWAQQDEMAIDVKPHLTYEPVVQKIQRLNQQLQQAEQNDSRIEQLIRQRALLDSETGIGNREYFSNRLDALLSEDDAQGAVLLIQFNDAVLFSDEHRHVDLLPLLAAAINRIEQRLASLPQYFIARQNDAELAVLVPNCYVDETRKLADKLLQSLCHTRLPIAINTDELVHIGISCFHHQQAYQIMAEADMALRTAQLQGPSQWFMFDSNEMAPVSIKGSLWWRTLLLWVLSHDAIETFFQAVIASHNDSIIHIETLAKIKDKQGKYISASLFLPMAQKCGLSTQIDLAMFALVWQQLERDIPLNTRYSLNVSTESLLSADASQHLLYQLDSAPDLAKRLIIEISEYHLVRQFDTLLPVLTQLKATGVDILVDRVGQYLVNANYLKSGLISYVKLHRSIVLNIHRKPENQVFIQSIKTLCEEQNVAVYALGVETFTEWQTLQRLGIDGGQGHFFTKPLAQVARAVS